MQSNEERPPYVEFVTRAVEDRTQAKTDYGTYPVKDIILAKITRPGQKDTVERLADEWIENLKKQAGDQRIPFSWVQHFSAALESFKTGQELPLNGIAIRGWQLLTPAQQETVIRAGIRTVEDLAALNQEGIGRLGMGAVTWKNAATAWLDQGKDKGAVADQIATLKRDNAQLNETVAGLLETVKALQAQQAPPPQSPASTL